MSTKYKMKCPNSLQTCPRVPSAALARFWKDRALTASRAVPRGLRADRACFPEYPAVWSRFTATAW